MVLCRPSSCRPTSNFLIRVFAGRGSGSQSKYFAIAVCDSITHDVIDHHPLFLRKRLWQILLEGDRPAACLATWPRPPDSRRRWPAALQKNREEGKNMSSHFPFGSESLNLHVRHELSCSKQKSNMDSAGRRARRSGYRRRAPAFVGASRRFTPLSAGSRHREGIEKREETRATTPRVTDNRLMGKGSGVGFVPSHSIRMCGMVPSWFTACYA